MPEASASVPIDGFIAGGAAERRPTLVESGFAPQAAPCATDPTTLCLNGGHFKVKTQWSTQQGQSGSGQAVALTGDTGYFWFFSSSNIEMVVKALDACAFNSRYWTFAGGLTDVNVIMTVTDTQTGAVKTYTNPQGTAFQPIQDTAAFPTCGPSPASFARSWSGGWIDRTFSSSGGALMNVTVDSVAQTFQITLDVKNLFGSGDKAPQTFAGTYASTGGNFSASSAVYGDVSGSITFPATANQYDIQATCLNVKDNFVERLDLVGTISPLKIELNYAVTIRQSAGGGTAVGTLTFN